MGKGNRNRPFHPFITSKPGQHKKDWGYDTEKNGWGSLQEPHEKIDKRIFQIKQEPF